MKNAKDPNINADKSVEAKSSKQDKKSQKKKEKPTNIHKKTAKPVKIYSKFKAFLKEIILDSNYHFVTLKVLLECGELHKKQIAESLAYFNNKDPADDAEIKFYLDMLSYDVLLNHEFIMENHKDTGLLYYSLNVRLSELQKSKLIDHLSDEIAKYNRAQGIPENIHPHPNIINNINWDIYKFEKEASVTKVENSIKNISDGSRNIWLWSATPTNWEIVKSKHVWGSRVSKEKIGSRVHTGDLIVFYIVGTNTIQGIFEFVGEWFNSTESLWDGGLKSDGSLKYPSKINLKPVQLGVVPVSVLYEQLELFIGKSQRIRSLIFQGRGGYPSNNNEPLLEEDFQIIKEHLVKNSLIDESVVKQSISKNVKECLKCHTRVENPSNLIFEHLVEEIFGHVQSDPGDPQTKKLQLYCRACVANFEIN